MSYTCSSPWRHNKAPAFHFQLAHSSQQVAGSLSFSEHTKNSHTINHQTENLSVPIKMEGNCPRGEREREIKQRWKREWQTTFIYSFIHSTFRVWILLMRESQVCHEVFLYSQGWQAGWKFCILKVGKLVKQFVFWRLTSWLNSLYFSRLVSWLNSLHSQGWQACWRVCILKGGGLVEQLYSLRPYLNLTLRE